MCFVNYDVFCMENGHGHEFAMQEKLHMESVLTYSNEIITCCFMLRSAR